MHLCTRSIAHPKLHRDRSFCAWDPYRPLIDLIDLFIWLFHLHIYIYIYINWVLQLSLINKHLSLILSSGTSEHFVLGNIYHDGDDCCHLPNESPPHLLNVSDPNNQNYMLWQTIPTTPEDHKERNPCHAAQIPGFPFQPQTNSVMPTHPGSFMGPLGFQSSHHMFSCGGIFPSEHLSYFLIQLHQSRARSVFTLHCITKQSVSRKLYS